jgi:hypothetical protein
MGLSFIKSRLEMKGHTVSEVESGSIVVTPSDDFYGNLALKIEEVFDEASITTERQDDGTVRVSEV